MLSDAAPSRFTFENTSAYQLVFKGILEEISEGKIQNIKAVNKNTAA